MSDTTAQPDDLAERKPSKLPLIISLVLGLAGAGGGFYVAQSGLLPFGKAPEAEAHVETSPEEDVIPTPALPDIAFVEVPPILISLGPGAQASHLRFRASLEVPSQYQEEVERILPRVMDVMNSYLRALEAQDFEAPDALIRVRGHLVRRIKLVAGEGRVRDLLVLEFVLN